MSESIQSRLGTIEGKLDMLIELHRGAEKRLGSVEKKVWWFSGAWALIAVALSRLPLSLR